MAGILPTILPQNNGGILSGLGNWFSAADAYGPGQANMQQRFMQALQQDPQFRSLSLPQQMDILNNPQALNEYSVGQKVEDANGNVRVFNPFNQQITGNLYNVPQAPKVLGPVKLGDIAGTAYSQGQNIGVVGPGGMLGGAPNAAQPQAGQPPQPGQTQPSGINGLVGLNNQIKQQSAASEAAGKGDSEAFQKEYTGIQNLGDASYNGIQKAQLMKNLTLQPGFYSGPFSKNVQAFNQFKATFGSNPSSALPTEAFNKVANDMLTEQIKSMGQSGVGRVLQSEVNMMKQAIASLGITPQSNRALAEITSRVYQQHQDLANLARQMPRTPGNMSQQLGAVTSNYLATHPLFTPQELQNPQLLGAPDAPPQALQGPQQLSAWAKSVGLQSGDPVRVGQRIIKVP